MDISGTLNHRTFGFAPCSPASSGLASVFATSSVFTSAFRAAPFVPFPVPLRSVAARYRSDSSVGRMARSRSSRDMSRCRSREISHASAHADVLEFNQRIVDASVGWSGIFTPDRFFGSAR